MCLAIPGKIVEMVDPALQLAKVEVGGVRRNVNVALLEPEGVGTGDWVLIHVGFAISRIDEAEAHATLQALEEIGEAYRAELAEIEGSRIE
jgi:hydrogenase expression/formation protein HypC